MSAAVSALGALARRCEGHRRLISATVEAEIGDPCAAVFASRLADDRWFCWEQPDRDGFALACLGSAHEAVSRGPDRFAQVAAGAGLADAERGGRWRERGDDRGAGRPATERARRTAAAPRRPQPERRDDDHE